MNAKHREITLLALALAMAFPACAGHVLCVDCCGSPRIVREISECPCCSPQEDTLPSCCQHLTVDSPTADDTAFDNPACECVDIPLDFSATRSAEKSEVPVVPIPKAPVANVAFERSPKTLSVLHKAPDHPPVGIDLLSSIVLLI